MLLELRIPSVPDTPIMEKLRQSIGPSPSPLENCLPTLQLLLQISSKNNTASEWILQAMDESGTPKTMGGDELYITWQDHGWNVQEHPSAVALTLDREDGSYELDFMVPPLASSRALSSSNTIRGGGNLTIHYQYTCGIGHMGPPTKDNWKDGGALFRTYTVEVPVRPTIRPFQFQNLLDPVTQYPIALSSYQKVLVFGDSAMRQFVKNASRVFHPNLVFRVKRRKPWTTALIDEHIMILGKQLGKDLEEAASNPLHSTALLVGSSIWDVLSSKMDNAKTLADSQSTDFEDHLKACKHFITSVRQRYRNVDLLWKSPTAMHIHVVLGDPSESANNEDRTALLNRVRYMSSSRMTQLYRLQQQVMLELKVPFLDIYGATYLSAAWTFPGDGRHYLPELNKHLLEWYYN
jgi:hypothetical protein